MRYFRSFESYENTRNRKRPISTYPAQTNNPRMLRASTHVSPREKSCWKLRLFLKNYSWYYRNTRIVDSQKTTEDFGLFQIKIMPRFCAVFFTALLKPYANLRLSFREPMTATLHYSSFP